MASHATPDCDTPPPSGEGAALQHRNWRRRARLSRVLAACEEFLATAGFDRAPWLAVAFAAGIAAWFGLPGKWQWLSLICACAAAAILALAWRSGEEAYPYLRRSVLVLPLLLAAGCACVWVKSALVGQPAIPRPVVAWLDARVLEREEQPAQNRARLVLATRIEGMDRPVRVRVNLEPGKDAPGARPGSRVLLRARLMPPARPMLPGGYDFARAAWFSGLAATGSVIAPVRVMERGGGSGWLDATQASLSRHVRERLPSAAGTIAATLASGDRGAIPETDAEAMRDSGLAHLLSISGLHVSALIAIVYALTLRLLALWPWLALRIRLPLAAAGAGALAGIGYTLLTGAEVPTVRSCLGALLVLAAVAMGREALSQRVLAVAAFVVLLFWPESLVGPSFQMSFASVMAIIALDQSAPVRHFLSARDETWARHSGRRLALLLLTGLVIELSLMPIGLYHFHRAGAYGAMANVIAIPLTTIVVMPLIALALVLDLFGAGMPAWWLVEKALSLLLRLAHFVADLPGAITMMPPMGTGAFLLFIAGGLWLALWHGRRRLAGLVPAALGAANLMLLQAPDVLVSGDGRHIGIRLADSEELLVLRDSRSDYVRENLLELAGMDGESRRLDTWPGARCNRDFCSVTLREHGRDWHVLIGRGRDLVPERALAAACDRADIVVADRRLPATCRPRWIKADRAMLAQSGGLAIDLGARRIRSVGAERGQHGW